MDLSTHHWRCQEPDGTIRYGKPHPTAILAGSFNPLHEGHAVLAEIARVKLGVEIAFEISVANVDKPDLTEAELCRRLQQFLTWGSVYVTRAATFVQKAELFPGAVMVVGADTAARVLDPRYYGDDHERRNQALNSIRDRGCRFLVAGRRDNQGRFIELSGIEVPAVFSDLFEAIPESEFRVDVSSTTLRAPGGDAAKPNR